MRTIVKIFLLLFFADIAVGQEFNLNFYLGKAKENSPLINKNKNENKIIELDLKLLKSILSKPEINIEANLLFAPIISHDNNSNRFEWVSSGADSYTGYDLSASDGGQYQAFVAINQPLFTGSMFRTYANKADISRQLNENIITLTEHELEQVVTYQYLLCLKSRLQKENSNVLLKELKEQLNLMQKLVDMAIYKQTDLMLLQIEYQNFEIESHNSQSEYQNSMFDLNLLCGINDTSIVEIKEEYLQLNPEKKSNSNFLISYKLDSLNIMAEQEISEFKYKPQVNLFANAGLNAVYQPTLNRFGFSTGLNLSWNIFDGNQRKIQRDKSKINIETLEFEKLNFVTQRDINKNKLRLQMSSLDQKIGLTEEQLKQYDKIIKIYSKELLQGEISVMDFKNLLKDIAAKKQEKVLLTMEMQLLINACNYWNY